MGSGPIVHRKKLTVFAGFALAAVTAAVRADAPPVTGTSPFVLTLAPKAPAYADVVTPNPADQPHEGQAPATRPASPSPLPPLFEVTHSWEMPAVEVVGQRSADLREEDRIGDYHQPRWTADRRFGETRVYVIPNGKVEFEYWLIAQVPRHGATETQHLFELEFGLPCRFQFDLYLIDRHEGSGGQAFIDGKFELRYALADWDVIWGNPTVYIEYKSIDSAPDEIEAKLLLGGEIAPRWHWGTNLVWDGQVGGDRETSYELTGGISYTVIDEKLSIGAETHIELYDEHNHRGNYTNDVFIGPSVQYRPRPNMHVDFAPLVGVGQEHWLEGFFIFGYEF